ncbi:type II toxin-antitoxin system VapC family toxin [Geminicoccus harenae]|uniref:type II toxin-antitoxin system VapC family toxin n=1 Tax=Geminicoccus harenae TaxID=2498453 RepID=UPI00168BCA30|nr:type II toxin-antitoxin system VapC family toxin [Geminicoccus harenae]
MNYILDTNVVSEMMRPQPDVRVHSWVTRKVLSQLFITATTINEITFGLQRLPAGRRRQELQVHLNDLVNRRFAGRILPFDKAAAVRCGEIRAAAMMRGRPAGFADAEIAAVALTHSMTVATRDLGDFAVFGVPLVDPFDPKAVA